MKVKYDLVVKTGSYTKDGEQKNQYENIGKVIQGDKGFFLLLKRTFNPAGVPTDRDMVMVSMFEPREKSSAPQQNAPKSQMHSNDFDSDVPFDHPYRVTWRMV